MRHFELESRINYIDLVWDVLKVFLFVIYMLFPVDGISPNCLVRREHQRSPRYCLCEFHIVLVISFILIK